MESVNFYIVIIYGSLSKTAASCEKRGAMEGGGIRKLRFSKSDSFYVNEIVTESNSLIFIAFISNQQDQGSIFQTNAPTHGTAASLRDTISFLVLGTWGELAHTDHNTVI